MPKISIAIPIHDTPKTAFFLSRMMQSLDEQTFTDYEIVITKAGPMAHNHNEAILQSKGEIIKILQMDDYFAHPQALENIVVEFDKGATWLITGAAHTDGTLHTPAWTDDIYTGNNRLGSISALSFRNDKRLLLEEPLTWVVDCDLYYRYFLQYGLPTIIPEPQIIVDTRSDRLTSTLPNDLKMREINYLLDKYAR